MDNKGIIKILILSISYPKLGSYSSSSEGKSSAGPILLSFGLCFLSVGILYSPSY